MGAGAPVVVRNCSLFLCTAGRRSPMSPMDAVPVPSDPLRVALIGAGQRARTIYRPLFGSLAPWLKLTAVCDPVREHADSLAETLGVPSFYDIHDLVRDRPMEAALVVTPVESHHAISCHLSGHGLHNLVETSWCSLVAQARDMIDTARRHNAVVRVAENFFRFPIDRIVQKLKAGGFLGEIRRIVSYADHTGYHNNSRWIVFAGAHPESVQSIEHTMPTAQFYETPERFHTDERYHARFLLFPDNVLVVDHNANVKGFLGRYPRPGYTEWQGERGSIAYFARRPWHGEGEIRSCSDEGLRTGRGFSDQRFPIVTESRDGCWTRTYVDLPNGRVEYVNPFRPAERVPHVNDWYGSPVMDHVVDFVLAVRGLRESEFDEEDALMSLMMEVGARQSALNEGKRVRLPLDGETESERIARENLKERFGVDPLDVEGMLRISYPKP